MPASTLTDTPIYQLKVTLELEGAATPVWRRIQVRADVSLFRLHQFLQRVMGWEDYHMHQFIVGKTFYGSAERAFGFEVLSDRNTSLRQVAPSPKRKFFYQYDMGDSWQHTILVEKILTPEPGVHYPVCMAGERACPPEDCGGVWGYANLLEAIGDPKHPEHDERLQWLGRPFDPEAFDIASVNRRLARLR